MYRIGIDLGGTNIAAGVVDESQHIVAEVSVPTGAERGAEAVVADICRAAELAMAKAGITAAHCASIGIGSPGTCDGSRGVVVRAYNLGWFNVPVCDMVTARLGLPCRLSNDANCAALAETVAGAAVGCRNMVLVTLGTGVGVGIVSDGKLLEGVGGTGAEAGHAILVLDGEPCTCGRKGCWEAYASATALIRQGRRAALAHPESLLARCGDALCIDTTAPARCDIPRELMHRMRSSVIFLGPLLARFGEAEVSLPGGCELGPRPIDLHLHALRLLGAEIEEGEDSIVCRASHLRGAEISLALPSVGATENAMIAACAAEGTTVIYNAAREPEIETLQSYLCALGADVSGAGSPVIRITGFSPRSHAGLRIPPDRIAAATYLCCTACAGGEIELTAAAPGQIVPVLDALRAMGCAVSTHGERIHMTAHGRPASPGAIVTRPYPGFPTDAAPLLMAASLRCTRPAMFIENIFSGRYRHAEEMRALGAQIVLRGPMALVTGVETLHGASMKSPDLRGGAALVAAALGAEGESTVTDAGHILRGYESLDETLRSLGASVWREKA